MLTAQETNWEPRDADSASTARLASTQQDRIIGLMRELYASGDADGALSLAALVADTAAEDGAGRAEPADEDPDTLWDWNAVPSFRTLNIPERSMDAAAAALLGLIDGETRLATIFDRLGEDISEADALAALQVLIDDGVIVTR